MRFSSEASAAAFDGLSLCARVIIPSLFPFFVISSLSAELGLAAAAGKTLGKPLGLLFDVGGSGASAFVLGLVGGYPVGAKSVLSLYENRACTRSEAERLLFFCNNSSPAFIIASVGAGLFGSVQAGMILYLAHVSAAVACGVLSRLLPRENASPRSGLPGAPLPAKAVPALVRSVRDGFFSVLTVCSFVVFFSVAVRILSLSGIFPAVSGGISFLLSPLGISPGDTSCLLSGMVEVTGGLWALADSSSSVCGRMTIASFLLGWGGLSVHCQTLSLIGDAPLSTRLYFFGKLLCACLSAAFTRIFFRFFPFCLPAFSSAPSSLPFAPRLRFSDSLRASLIASLLLCGFFLIPLLRSDKDKRPKKSAAPR